MAENLYLKNLRAKYSTLEKSVNEYLARAARENRELGDVELDTVKGQRDEMDSLLTKIEDLVGIEKSNARSAKIKAEIAAMSNFDEVGAKAPEVDEEATTAVRASGGATAVDRDPGHYRKDGKQSFFADMIRSRQSGNEAATRRLVEHTRALDTGEGAGVIAPKWLMDEFSPLLRQGRKLANVVRTIDITGDPRPIVLPHQTSGADNVDTPSTGNPRTQTAENAAVASNDKWDSDIETVSPVTVAGYQVVSRQFLDSATPSVDALIYGDMIAAYDEQIERRIGSLILAAGPTALAATEGPVTTATHFARVAQRAALAVRQNRKLPASLLAMSVGRYGDFLDLYDTTGRPLLPTGSDGPMNVLGIGSVAVDGRLRELGIVATDGIAVDDEFAAFRPQDVILFEGNVMRFRYEEVEGPQSIRLGLWAYVAATVRYEASSVQVVEVAGS